MGSDLGQPSFRLSVRELLLVIGFLAVAAGALASHSWMASPVIGVLSIVFVAMVIRAVVAGPRDRIFAVGFVIAVCFYLAATVTMGDHEYRQSQGVLPTSQLLQALIQPPYGTRGDIILERAAEAKSLMPLGHFLIAAAAGYCGGKYAVWVYIRTRRQPPSASNDPSPPGENGTKPDAD